MYSKVSRVEMITRNVSWLENCNFWIPSQSKNWEDQCPGTFSQRFQECLLMDVKPLVGKGVGFLYPRTEKDASVIHWLISSLFPLLSAFFFTCQFLSLQNYRSLQLCAWQWDTGCLQCLCAIFVLYSVSKPIGYTEKKTWEWKGY